MTNKNESLQRKKLNFTIINFFQNQLTWSFWRSCLSIASALKFKTTEKKHNNMQKNISRKTNIFQKILTLGFLARLSLGVCSAVAHQSVELTKKSFFHE